MSNDVINVGLDIGTSRVRCVIGEPAAGGKMNVLGFGQAESRGMRRGVVTATESVAESIKAAITEAERSSGIEVDAVMTNLSGEHLSGENKTGVVAVAGVDKEIDDDDVERAVSSASALTLTPGWEVVAKIPQEFIIDGQDGISEPVGMLGTRLEARVHVISSPGAARQNLLKAVAKAGYDAEDTILEPLAAAESILTEDDREYGCAVVNIGAEITSLMIFGRGSVQHTAVFPFGSMLFTKDIATGLRTSIPDSNKIKREFGCVAGFLLTEQERQEVIEIQPFGRDEIRGLSKEILTDILQPRAVELLQHVAERVQKTGSQISGGVFLTGGGSKIRGMAEIAEQVFDAPTRVGYPLTEKIGGLGNEVAVADWSVACGLALMSMRAHLRGEFAGSRRGSGIVADLLGNIRDRFR